MTKTKQNYISQLTNKAIKAFKPAYEYKGEKNKTSFPFFIELCKYTQEELKKFLPDKLLEIGYEDVVVGDGYVYAKGNIPVLLTAHMDTVHKEPVKDFYEFVDENGCHIISSPQGIGGDDRCGIYMILDVIKERKCSVLFCEDEESGRVGAKKFVQTDLIEELEGMNFLIELDRRDAMDAVFYDCDNPDFTNFVCDTTGYKKAWGSYSDISTLAPACAVAAVNLSCGYYNAHTLSEEVNVEEMMYTIEMVKRLIDAECPEQFKYMEKVSSFKSYGNYYGNTYGYSGSNEDYYDTYDYDDYYGWYGKEVNNDNSYIESYYLTVEFKNPEDETQIIEDTVDGISKGDCWFNFFVNNPDVSFNMIDDYYYDYEYWM